MIRRAASAASTPVVVVLAAGLFAIAFAPQLGIRATILTSGSMVPTVPPGGMIAVQEVDPVDVEVGDVITFRGYAEDKLVTHRVISLHDIDGELHFRTQGDANEFADGDLAPAAGVVGRMRWDLTPVGPVLAWLTGSRAKLLIPGLAGMWLALGEVRELRRSRHPGPADRRIDRPVPTSSPPVPPPWLVWPPAPTTPQPPPAPAPPTTPAPVATAPAVLSWSAPSTRSRAAGTARAWGGSSRFATVGLATVLALSSLQASAGSFLDSASVSAATISTTSIEAPSDTTATFDCGLSTIGQHVTVSWTAVNGADDYEVRRRTGTTGDFAPVGTTSSTSFTDTSIALDTTYEYVVVTRSGTWESSPSSPPAQVTAPATCG